MTRGGWLGLAIVAVVFPLVHPQPFYLDVASLSALFLLLALGMNIILGWTGLLHLGYVAVYGVAAYVTGYLMRAEGVSFWLALLASIGAAVAANIVMGLLTLRLRGDYFLVVTLAFAQLFSLGVANWTSVTGGSEGLYGIPPASFAGTQIINSRQFYYFVLAFTAVGLGIAAALRRSGLMQTWLYVRGDEFAAEVIGTKTVRAKFLAVAVGAGFAALAGALLTVKLSTVAPDSFTFSQTVTIFLCVLIGGLGSLGGLVVGVVLIVALPDAVSIAPEYQLVAFGVLLILIVLVRPSGLLPARLGLPQVERYVRSRRQERSTATSSTPPAGRAPARARQAEAERRQAGVALLRLKDVSVRFGGVDALKDLSLTLHEGEILGMIGPNGSGKTTALNTVSGVVRPYRGSVRFGDEELTRCPPHQMPRLGVARTFQHARLFSDLSVLDNVRAGLFDDGGFVRPLLVWREQQRLGAQLDAAREALDFVDPWLFPNVGDVPIARLSFARRRLVEIARALCSRPQVLLLDEPAAGLDIAQVESLIDLVRRIRDAGISVWIVEHNMDVVASVADRVIALVNGRLVVEGEIETVTTNPELVTAYLGSNAL